FGDWTVAMVDSGAKQWAFQGHSLYTYAGDVNSGEINGNDVEGWSVLVLEPEPPLPPWATVQASDAGELIANAEGHTVYTQFFNPRNRRLSPAILACNGECVDPVWIPFLSDADAKPTGLWTIVTRKDGRKQWAYKGQRIFTHADDKKAGDFKGIRFGGNRMFSAIMRNGMPMQGVSVGG
ncbi:MAG: hypothetical protein KDE14_15270, partial [Rhodobacteraceae bacterium]|nr:hypothetical protein [Paracoccaceae bacterium]